jgi:DNA-binding SARP family transcriptional activator
VTANTLGAFSALLDGLPIQEFGYDKVRALLAYLAVESAGEHRREELTGLLWPERPEPAARSSLSQALFRLRHALGNDETQPPFLLVTHETIRFNPASDSWVDSAVFTAAAPIADSRLRALGYSPLGQRIEQLETSLGLYRG